MPKPKPVSEMSVDEIIDFVDAGNLSSENLDEVNKRLAALGAHHRYAPERSSGKIVAYHV